MSGRLRSAWYGVGPWRVHALVPVGAPPEGVPLVLVHGFGVSTRYWKRLASRLARHHPVYAPDLPGHGPSSKPPDALDVPAFRTALSEWMAVAGLSRVVIVANSMGCQIAAELAANEPERVDSLVLCGPTVDPSARTAPRQIFRLLLSAPAEDPRLGPLLTADYLRAGIGRLRAELGHMLRHRIELALPGVKAPALVLRGAWDRVVPRGWAEQAARLLPRGELVQIPAAGHAAHYTRPGAIAARVLEFTARRSPPPGGTPPPARTAPERGARD